MLLSLGMSRFQSRPNRRLGPSYVHGLIVWLGCIQRMGDVWLLRMVIALHACVLLTLTVVYCAHADDLGED